MRNSLRVGQAVYPYRPERALRMYADLTLSDETGPFGRSLPLVAAIKRALIEAGHATP